MDKRIKLLFVLGSMHNGGTEAFAMNYFRNIDKRKFSIDFLVIQGDEEYFKEEIETAGSQIYHLFKTEERYVKRIKKIRTFFIEHEYDIVHIHSCSLQFMATVAYAAKHGKGNIVIGHAHSVGEPTGTWEDNIARYILKAIISHYLDYGMACSSDSARAKFTKKLICANRYFMMPNAIEIKKYGYDEKKRDKIREQYKLDDKLVVGIVGRLEKWKNQSFLLEAVQVVNQRREIYLMAIGDGDIREDLEMKAKRLGIADKVIFTGAVANANEYYSAMDLFCLPSYGEGFPFVLVEAQANGLKCLISDAITRETNVSGESKYLSIDNPKIWADAIDRYIGMRITEKSIQKIKEKYDIQFASKKLEHLYENLREKGRNR